MRTLAGVASGAISLSNFYGKANAFAATITTNQLNLNLQTWALANGWNGTVAATITIGSGVYIWSNLTGTPALTINGSWPGGLTLVNNGYIMGMGGDGGYTGGTGYVYVNPQAGGPAISISTTSVSIQNNSYIAGGGGGGGGTWGGGGAGGGRGGSDSASLIQPGMTPGGAVGLTGTNGRQLDSYYMIISGGGGGRILPGIGGAGGVWTGTMSQGGGAAGGNGSPASGVGIGAAGGKGIQLNGVGITWIGGAASSSRVYGAVV